jgi:Ankyrin repeat
MASDHDRSLYVEPLPPRPSLEMQQKRAKDLLRAAWRSEADALARIRALHPKPPDPATLKLADAQLVIARGYGFESWAALKRRIEALTLTPVDQFRRALDAGDVEAVRRLLAEHAEVRAAVNEPCGPFGGRPVSMAARNLPLLDVLLANGADINLKSAWPPGGFGLLETGTTPEQAAPLIARGAIVDVFAAANLGMLDRLGELVDGDPTLVHARGGDGKTALHCATSMDIARYLVERGADVDARCVDHFSTPAQYLVRDHPDIARLLVERGAWFDIFIAVALRDHARIEHCLREDPEALDHRTWHGKYELPRGQDGVPVRDVPADCRGDIYRWVFDHNVSAMDVAATLGFDDVVQRLGRAATPAQRLLAACWRADRSAAEAAIAQQPDVVRTLSPAQISLIAYKAHAGDTAAVALMIDLGFDARAKGTDQAEPLRWAAFLGNAAMVTLLLAHDPPIGERDAQFQGTPLGWCVYGAVHGWACRRGDFPTCVRLLIAAGEQPDPSMLPSGRDDVDVVLREYFARV